MFMQEIEDGAGAAAEAGEALPTADDVIDLMLGHLSDGLDHPELWADIPVFVEHVPGLASAVEASLQAERRPAMAGGLKIISAMVRAAAGEIEAALGELELLAVANSQSPLVQGAIFHLHGLLDPDNPKYRLEGMFCTTPFEQIDVLERSSHLCCASWLRTSTGDFSREDWKSVWNSPAAQDIRASIHDGSFRHCNKMACPKLQGTKIQNETLMRAEEVAARSDHWRDIVEKKTTDMPDGPAVVNLAYDRSCNLSCPSCRTERYAADNRTRQLYEAMQERSILPMLKEARTVFITGSGDPFASKNFRRLMEQLGADDYPDLRFQIMTNGMLFNRREWEKFPALHGRVSFLRISIDAAAGPTHELLRRGARWDVVLENLKFAGELRRQGLVDAYELSFTVQVDNFREMGDARDLAREVGASLLCFSKLTNWGTFTDEEYRQKAVFMPSHPEHAAFVEMLRDERLRDPIVRLANLGDFAAPGASSA